MTALESRDGVAWDLTLEQIADVEAELLVGKQISSEHPSVDDTGWYDIRLAICAAARRAALRTPATTGEGEVVQGAWSAEACDLIERLAKRVEDAQQEVVHATWFYDGSCNAWEPPNDTAEAQDSEMADLAAAIRALAALPPSSGCADACREAMSLANSLWRQHYQETAPNWKPLDDLRGIISQIDNMTTGLTRKGSGWEAGAEAMDRTLRAYVAGLEAAAMLIEGYPYWLGRGPKAEIAAAIRALPLPPPPSREGV